MQTLETIKTKSQETLNNLLEKGKERPEEVKAWGITAGGAVVGALTVTAAAKGVVAIFAAIAAPPIALTLGAVGGGVLGWNFMQKQDAARSDTSNTYTSNTDTSNTEASAVAPAVASTPVVAEPTVVPTPEPIVAAAVATPVAEMVNVQADEVVTPVTEVPIAEATTVAAESATTATAAEAPVDTTEALVPESAVAMAPESPTDPVVESPAESMSETMTPDNLEAINGIGPVYASRLHTAGVKTFAHLAELTPDRIQEIIGPIRSGHMIEAEKWIAEALKFAGQGTA